MLTNELKICSRAHGANEMGAPLVDIVNDCAAGELGGERKFNVGVLNVSVEGAGVTTSVTGMVIGATPVTVTP